MADDFIAMLPYRFADNALEGAESDSSDRPPSDPALYQFIGRADAVTPFVFEGARFYQIATSLFSTSGDPEDIFAAVIVVGSHSLQDNYVPQEGDRISGVLWLHGQVSPRDAD